MVARNDLLQRDYLPCTVHVLTNSPKTSDITKVKHNFNTTFNTIFGKVMKFGKYITYEGYLFFKIYQNLMQIADIQQKRDNKFFDS